MNETSALRVLHSVSAHRWFLYLDELSMRITNLLMTLVVLLFVASPLTATASTPEFRFPGEEFYYSIRFNNVEAMRVGVRAGDVRMKDNKPYVAIAGTAQSTGFFHSIYPINDRANTYLNPDTYKPLRSEKFFDERGDKRNYRVDYIHSTYQARVERERDQAVRRFNMAIPGTTHDMISWIYHLRTREDFALNQQMTYYIYDGWKLSALRAKVVGKEDIHTPMGWFKAWRVDFERDILNSRGQRNKEPILRVRDSRQSTASMWISRDENRLPIKVSINTPLGSAEAVLIKLKLSQK